MDELTITVTIAGRPFRMTIPKSEEEVIRKAAKLINEKIKEYSGAYAFKDTQDLLSMVSLEFATNALDKESRFVEFDQKLVDNLKEINNILSDNLQ